MSTIPGNSLQQKFREQIKNIRKPTYGVKGTKPATLIKVYDRSSLQDSDVPGELAKAIASKPGRLYGQVKTSNNEIFFLPFANPPELIYSVYGNGSFLEGRIVRIVFYDKNINQGEIELISQEIISLKDMENSTNIFDIGSIF